jgi:hypothetical protein
MPTPDRLIAQQPLPLPCGVLFGSGGLGDLQDSRLKQAVQPADLSSILPGGVSPDDVSVALDKLR